MPAEIFIALNIFVKLILRACIEFVKRIELCSKRLSLNFPLVERDSPTLC